MTDDRIRLVFPPRVLFETEMAVSVGDINYGGHLANDAVLRLAHEARLRFLAARGCSETDVSGFGLIMADAAVQYRNQAFRGDVLCFQVALGAVGSAGFSLYCRVYRTADAAEIALVKNGMVFFDYARQCVVRTPAGFADLMGADG